MMGRYGEEMLANVAEMLPEFQGLKETQFEWWIATISFWKSSMLAHRPMNRPTYRRGFTFDLPEDMRLTTVPFTKVNGSAAIALLLRSPREEFLAGWVSPQRRELAETTASFLNREIEAAWEFNRKKSAGADEAPTPSVPARWMTFVQGSEHAPDSPWGTQQLRISTTGLMEYEHRNRGRNRSIRGSLDRARCEAAFAALASTAFPRPPQTSFLPGASGLTIETDSPPGKVIVDYFDGLEMPGYAHVIRELSELNTALRTSDAGALGGWGFVDATPPLVPQSGNS